LNQYDLQGRRAEDKSRKFLRKIVTYSPDYITPHKYVIFMLTAVRISPDAKELFFGYLIKLC
jgi:hypothetical protein